MKMNFFKDEWEEFIENCGFTDDETEVVSLLRKGWCLIDIAEELNISHSTAARRRKRIGQKIIRYISKN
jgi:DNA-binding NarL/FixJ family response regulator